MLRKKRMTRNEPCHCGSGHKYKNCCLLKDEEGARTMSNQNLKNDFRSEVEKEKARQNAECVVCRKLLISVMPPVPEELLKYGVCSLDCMEELDIKNEAERVGKDGMLRRDQFATMIQLRLQKKMRDKDVAYTKAAIEDYEDFLDELARLPISQARAGMTKMIEKQVGTLVTQAAQGGFQRPHEITLSALEEIFEQAKQAKPAEEIASPEPATKLEEEIIPPDPGAKPAEEPIDKGDELDGPDDDEL